MWLILGLISIALTITNLVLYKMGKEYKLAMACALSFTALTTNSFYTILTDWVVNYNWPGLLDVAPYVNTPLFVLIGISIGLNMLPILLETIKKRKLKEA